MLVTQNTRFTRIYDAFRPFLEEYGIRKISVFGSYAKGTDSTESDIDLLVDISKQFGIYKFIQLKQNLEASLGKQIDLVETQCLEPLIKDTILSEAITIYEQR
jgi:predicted nucleotidyltransferase